MAHTAAPDDLQAYAVKLGIEPDDELLPQAMQVPLSAAWRECWDEHGAKFYHSATLGRSSWTHPRRDAFLQRYVTLKAARELDEHARPELSVCLARISGGGEFEAEAEQLLAFGALAAQLLASLDITTEPHASAVRDFGTPGLLKCCQALLQPVVADMAVLKPALRRAAAENEDLANKLEGRRAQLEVLEQRQRTVKAQLSELRSASVAAAGAPPSAPVGIGRRAWKGSLGAAPAVADGTTTAVTLSLSTPLTLFEGEEPASLAEWLNKEPSTDDAAAGAEGNILGICSGAWSLKPAAGAGATGDGKGAAWSGSNTWTAT